MLVETSVFSKITMFRDSNGVIHLSNSESHPKRAVPKSNTKIPKKDLLNETRKIIDVIDKVALDVGVEPALIRAIARAESAFNPLAVSHKGAVGIMQLMPDTAKRFDVTDIYSIEQNILGGAKYLKYLTNLFSHDLKLVIAAYNAGEGRVLADQGIPNFSETIDFVDRVIKFYKYYGGTSLTGPIKKFIDENGHIHLTNL